VATATLGGSASAEDDGKGNRQRRNYQAAKPQFSTNALKTTRSTSAAALPGTASRNDPWSGVGCKS